MSEHLAALVCQTVQAVFVSEQDLDLQIRIHVEKNEASHHLVDLLKMGIITWKHPSCKVLQSKGVCEGCCKTFATQGEIHICLGFSGNNKCPDCLQNPQDMEKTFAENETEFCDRTEEVVKEGHLTSKNDDDDDKVCKEENDDNHEECVNLDDVDYAMEKNTSDRSFERVEDIYEHTLESEKTVLDFFCMEIKMDGRKIGRKSYVQFKCRLCSKMFPSKATILQHLGEHKDEVHNLIVVRDSAVKKVTGNGSGDDGNIQLYKCKVCSRSYQFKKTLKRHQRTNHTSSELEEVMGNVGGDVDDTEITDRSMGKSTVNHDKTGNINDGDVLENTDQSVGATVIHVKRKRNDSNIRPYKCKVCGRTYQFKKTLNRHQRTSHTSSELEEVMGNVDGDEIHADVDATEITDHTYSVVGSTVNHEHDEQTGNVSDGEVTQKTDQSVNAAVIFMERSQNDRYVRPYKCEVCGISYQLMKTLRRHKRTSHNPSELKEPMGNEVVAGNTDQDVGATVVYVKRKRNDSNIRPYKCEVCGRTYQLRKTLKRHQRTSHTSSELEEMMGNVSGDVDVVDNTDQNMGKPKVCVKRRQTVCNSRPYECKECGNTYQLLSSLKSHEQTHQTGQYCCGVCGREYHLKSRLMHHLRLHTGERPFKCTICSSSFRNNSNLTRHLKTHNKEYAYTCSKCGKGFTEASYLAIHERKHSGERPYKCQVCGKCFTNVSTLNVHRSMHITDRTYKCEICLKPFKTLRDVRVHKVIHTNLRSHVCEICGSGFITQPRLRKHKKIHDKERPFACKICLKTFLWNSDLKIHAVIHSDDKPFKCDVCDKSFSRKRLLILHSSKHTSEHPHKCTECDKSFPVLYLLQNHLERHSSTNRTYKCEICLKTFKTLRDVLVHKVIHTSLRSHVCEICGSGFITQHRLRRHKKIHSKERPFACKICLKTFLRKADLKTHSVIHSDDKPFKCGVCDKSFSRKRLLLLHSYNHASEHPHKCTECDKSFPVLHLLKKHSGLHSSNKPFMCELCGKSFRLIGLLRSHFRTHNGYRPHACDICGRKYRSLWYMQIHRKTHTGENLIQCKDCGDWFVNPSYFKIHQRKHCKGGKVVYCSICNHRFFSNRDLEKHNGLHTGERPFGCDICAVAFSKKASLQDHIKRHTQKNVHKCGTCGKGFKRATDLRKHEKLHAKTLKKVLLLDDMKPGHNNDITALQKDLLQQLTGDVQVTESMQAMESMQATESISDSNEPGFVYVDVVQLSTINNGQFQQNQEVAFLESSNSQHVEERVKVEIDHPYISDVPPVPSIQTSEGVSPSQSFTSTDEIIIQVDHPYISSQTATSDGVQIQALTTEACGVVSSANHTEMSGSHHSDTAISIGVGGSGTGTGATPDTDSTVQCLVQPDWSS